MAAKHALLALSALAFSALTLSGCGIGGWFGGDDDAPLPGTRISVLEFERGVEADPAMANVPVVLPPAEANASWPQAGAVPTHAPGHLALSGGLEPAWSSSIGEGGSDTRRILTPPIIVDGRIYALDSTGAVSAMEQATGRRLWRVRVSSPEEDNTPLGGGLAYGDGLLFASTGFGEVLAVDPANGGLVWRTRVSGPVRSGPAFDSGRIFVVTIDNELEALDAATGQVLWTHTGIVEEAGLLGSATPAVGTGVVIAPYSSGEVFALRVESGRPAWSDSLVAIRRVGPLATLADIRGAPVISDDLVIVTSHSGRTAGIDLRTGVRVWEQPVGGIQMPWVAGDFIFLISNDSELVALSRETGQVRWVTSLPRWNDPEDRTDAIVWTGPVLAGGRLIVASSEGSLIQIDPADGTILAESELRDGTTLPPVVAGGTLYILGQNGDLTAYN
ncbi:PQQ-binding-like beta-propeller repeat protein [Inquilinus sp. CAU 1745]|uniref:outer membrane protein assembly factor BamB family protein n=1 Tax=Inquilinus sp. CAU 1745 TaxID=3140369 RepID=UPI00325B8DD5